MKKIVLIITLFISAIVAARIPHRYYIGETEVDVAFWNAIPDSIKQGCASEKWDYDSLISEKLHLPIEYFLDSIGGNYIIKRRSDEMIAQMRSRLSILIESDSQGKYRLHIGDSVPGFSIVKNPGGAVVDKVLYPGKCYLINFWATWCGNCLLELLPTEMPQLAEKFIDEKDFVFLPICIDSSLRELDLFFNSERGARWKHLEYVTTLDNGRYANAIFAESGNLPLTVVVGKDGIVRYIHIGRISTGKEFREVENAIVEGLSVQE